MHTHRVSVLAAQASGLERLHPEAGAAWRPRELWLATHPRSALPCLRDVIGPRELWYAVPDDQIDQRLDVSPWLDPKVAAILAHRSEVRRGALAGVIAGLAAACLGAELLGTGSGTRGRDVT